MLSAGVLVCVAGVVVIAPSAASAHDTQITAPTAVCDSETGTYTITYTGHGDFELDSIVTVVSASPAGTTVSPQSQTALAIDNGDGTYDDPFTLVQTGVPGDATTASITISQTWTDEFTLELTATASELSGTCTKSASATKPEFTDSSCDGSTPKGASYTIPDVTGVVYKVGGKAVDAGTYPATGGTTVTIVAEAQPGYSLDGPTTFSHTFGQSSTCTMAATAVSPTFTDGVCNVGTPVGASYTLAAVTGVTYLINGNLVASGTYPAVDGATVTVTATAAAGYTLDGPTTFTHTYAAAPACDSGFLAFTGSSTPVPLTVGIGAGLLAVGGLLLVGALPRRRRGAHSA